MLLYFLIDCDKEGIVPIGYKTFTVVAAIAVCTALTACAPRNPEMGAQNVDQAQYNRDLAVCQQQAASSFSLGNAVTDCMRARGYRVM
jgi:hypothetical protein